MWVVERWEKGKTEPSSRMDYPTFEEAKDGAHIRCLGDSIAIHWEEPERTLGPMEQRAVAMTDMRMMDASQREAADFIQHLARAVDDLTAAVR